MRFQFTNPSSSSYDFPGTPASSSQQRFASNVLHTNMQVWALGLGIGVALLKFNRILAAMLSSV
jgi:hypothetical protein